MAKTAKRKYSPGAGNDVKNEMHRYKRGDARSGQHIEYFLPTDFAGPWWRSRIVDKGRRRLRSTGNNSMDRQLEKRQRSKTIRTIAVASIACLPTSIYEG